MIACSCKSIVMGKQSNLGPIDPQLGGLPAAAVKNEIERAIAEIAADPARLQFWQFVLGKYQPTFVSQCDLVVEMAEKFVRDRLLDNMFAGDAEAAAKADKVVKGLSDVEMNKAHDRHIHIDACEELGLKIERLEDDQSFQETTLTVHHCYMHSLSESGATKIVENHEGQAFVKIPA